MIAIIYLKYGSMQKFFNDTKELFTEMDKLRDSGIIITGYEVIK